MQFVVLIHLDLHFDIHILHIFNLSNICISFRFVVITNFKLYY